MAEEFKTYVGTKIIQAKPMSNGDLVAPKPGYAVTYEDGSASWSPKDVFEKAYRPIEGLPFGLAFEAARAGKRIARKSRRFDIDVTVEDGRPVIRIDGGTASTYGPSDGDLMADDWEILS